MKTLREQIEGIYGEWNNKLGDERAANLHSLAIDSTCSCCGVKLNIIDQGGKVIFSRRLCDELYEAEAWRLVSEINHSRFVSFVTKRDANIKTLAWNFDQARKSKRAKAK